MFWLDGRLGLPHDVIDITQKCGVTAVAFAVLIALLEKRAVPENTVLDPAACDYGSSDISCFFAKSYSVTRRR